jgi:Rps23 Pro-64 3,4-dihydroxylase Tpa1-like proline 4-hydroxylase
MIFNNYTINSLPVVVIDNYYSDQAAEEIWKELEFYSRGDKLLEPSKTGAATNKNKESLKKNGGLFLDEVYADRNVSNILTENRKLWESESIDKLTKIHTFFRYLSQCNRDTTLVSYYEDSDYYLPHLDTAVVTLVSWFYKKPKKFSGGSLTFEKELTIDCEYNRTVIFPSILSHAVDTVLIDEDYRNKNYGRYTITQLISFR